MSSSLVAERVWIDKSRYDNAERQYYESLSRDCIKNQESENTSKVVMSQTGDCETHIANGGKVTKGKFKKSKNKKHLDAGDKAVPFPHDKVAFVQKPQQQNHGKASGKKNNSIAINVHSAMTTSKSVPSSIENYNNSVCPFINPNYGATNMKGPATNNQCNLVMEIAKAREHIKNSLEKMDGIATLAASPVSNDVMDRILNIERENKDLRKLVDDLMNICIKSEKRISVLETQFQQVKISSIEKPKVEENDNDDGVDLFASDSEEESADAARIREERLAAYAAKKSKKPALIAKSSLVLDVKPWSDETNLTEMESNIRKITCDGLLWGASKFVPVAFGIKKLTISCVVEDEKVSIDWLTEEIEKLEDYVQSVDVAAFNKI